MSSANPVWVNAVWEVIHELALEGNEFTSEDVLDRIPESITTTSTKSLGGIMARAMKERVILPIGFKISPKYGHPKRVYIGNN